MLQPAIGRALTPIIAPRTGPAYPTHPLVTVHGFMLRTAIRRMGIGMEMSRTVILGMDIRHRAMAMITDLATPHLVMPTRRMAMGIRRLAIQHTATAEGILVMPFRAR